MNEYDESVALCALNKIFGYQPRLALQLLDYAGSAQALFRQPPREVELPESFTEALSDANLQWAQGELARMKERGFRFLHIRDRDYPALLRECDDPPLGLYLNGTSAPGDIFSPRPAVAIVGTRDISPYGKVWCRKLVEALSRARTPPLVVSGLAFGADGIAHRSALEFGLPTVGVMATGIEQVYPWQHERLAMEMVRTPGCALVTDYPTGTQPVAHNFLRRNRIIAGLSRAVLVVESKSKGGSLMTARYACEYNREVYALPGRADDARSAGCNSLIHTHMAEIITSPEALVDALGLGRPATGRAPHKAEGDFRAVLERRYKADSEAVALGMAVYGQRGIGPEELALTLQLPYPRVLELIGLLEADGFLGTDLLRGCFVREMH